MNKKLRIYLAGHVPEYDYRKYCIENYGEEYELLDPIAMVSEDQNYITIVEDDKKLIETSDILIAWIRKCTFGTVMEIPHAFDHNVPVLVVNPDGKFKNDVWLKYHSEKIFQHLDECFSYIKETYVK